MSKGFNKENCRRRNKIMSARGKVETAPINFLTDVRTPKGEIVDSKGSLPQSDTEALALINSKLPAGSKRLEPSDVYIRYMEAANGSLVTDRHIFLGTSTLVNIASGGIAGVSFMNSHRTGKLSTPAEMPFGQTFAGRYEAYLGADGNVHERALLGVYLLRGVKPNGDGGPSTDDLYRMIDGGQLKDVSVGLMPGDTGNVLCDVCGDSAMNCAHVAGTTRKMSENDKDAQRERGVASGKATYTIEGYEIGEVSAVYDGAVTGAGFSKGLAFLEDLTPDERQQFREAFHALMEDDSEEDEGADDDGETNDFGTQPKHRPQWRGQNTDPNGSGENKHMKEKLAKALARLGLGKMTAAVLMQDSDNPEDLASAMSSQVEAEVAERMGSHPLVVACKANNIENPADLEKAMESKRLGDKFMVDLRSEAKAEAIRAYGAELGPTISAQVDSQPAVVVTQLRDSWRTQADAKFGTDGKKPAPRQTAPAGTVAAVVEEEDEAPKTAWEQLSKEQQTQATAMGHNTEAKREAFAKNLLGQKDGSGLRVKKEAA